MRAALSFAASAFALAHAAPVPTPTVTVTCAPKTVKAGTPFFITVNFNTFYSRPVGVHVDMLDSNTKTYLAGDIVTANGATGNVTAKVVVPAEAQEPFEYNVFLTPSGESWPNVLASTTFSAPLSDKVTEPCAPIKGKSAGPDIAPDFDYVVLNSFPQTFTAGQSFPVTLGYNLATATAPTTVSVAMMRSTDNSLVASAAAPAQAGLNQAKLNLAVPADVVGQQVYLVANLTPEGKAWEDRLAEDRIYNTAVNAPPARRLRA
jgi:hypothetical protein